MKSEAKTVEEYIEQLPEERQEKIRKIREAVLKNLPEGFREEISYGMIGYVVPHAIYPDGYHCTPEKPLPFLNIASQKNHIAVYHSGIYADSKMMDWFTGEYRKMAGKKPDMGKSCIRFKKTDDIPYGLIGELARKMTVNDWISLYEQSVKRKNNLKKASEII